MTKAWSDFCLRTLTPGDWGTAVVLWLASAFLVPFMVLFDVMRWGIRLLRDLLLLSAETTQCPAGHEIELWGTFECACGCTRRGHAWTECPHCGERAHGLSCACGLTVKNPLSPLS